MADPTKPGIKTTEFWLTLVANLIGAVLMSGLVLEDSQLSKILGIAAIVLSTLGYTVTRGMLKKENARSEGGFVDRAVMYALGAVCAFMLVVVSVTACGAFRDQSKAAGKAFVDCTNAKLAPTIAELRPLGTAMLSNAVQGGSVDWGPVRDIAKGFATDVGRCVVADAITRLLAPPPPGAPKLSPIDVDPATARALVKDLYGVSFKTENGDL